MKIGLKHKRNANINLIKRLIDKGIPVLTEVNAKKFYNDKNINWTHILIVLGYDDNNFYFHDPDKDYGGKFKKVSINKFKKSWEKSSKFVGRSMFVIKKIVPLSNKT